MTDELDKLYKTGSSFLNAYQICTEQRPVIGGKLEMPLVPSITCLAFAATLYLKFIVGKEENNFDSNDQMTLFKRISSEKQKSIISGSEIDQENFLKGLMNVSEAFEEWRYVFNRGTKAANTKFLLALVKSLRNVIKTTLTNV